jgi:hypothetical protein
VSCPVREFLGGRSRLDEAIDISKTLIGCVSGYVNFRRLHHLTMALMDSFNRRRRGEFIFFNVCFNDIAGSVAVDEVNNAVCVACLLSVNEDSHVLRRVRK